MGSVGFKDNGHSHVIYQELYFVGLKDNGHSHVIMNLSSLSHLIVSSHAFIILPGFCALLFMLIVSDREALVLP